MGSGHGKILAAFWKARSKNDATVFSVVANPFFTPQKNQKNRLRAKAAGE
jgi:hypothetical protein